MLTQQIRKLDKENHQFQKLNHTLLFVRWGEYHENDIISLIDIDELNKELQDPIGRELQFKCKRGLMTYSTKINNIQTANIHGLIVHLIHFHVIHISNMSAIVEGVTSQLPFFEILVDLPVIQNQIAKNTTHTYNIDNMQQLDDPDIQALFDNNITSPCIPNAQNLTALTTEEMNTLTTNKEDKPMLTEEEKNNIKDIFDGKQEAVFTKWDSHKLRFDIIDPQMLEDLAYILTMGSAKYDKDGELNWKKLPQNQLYRYEAALLRHLNQWRLGKKIDDESHKNHLVHVICNAMFLYYFDNLEQKEKS